VQGEARRKWRGEERGEESTGSTTVLHPKRNIDVHPTPRAHGGTYLIWVARGRIIKPAIISVE
jgi:hypothetical protein